MHQAEKVLEAFKKTSAKKNRRSNRILCTKSRKCGFSKNYS